MSNNDLISRSEVEKLGVTCLARRNENGQLEAIISLDNAPTVEQRPQGEWIEKVERRGCFAGDKTVYSYTCPFCGVKEFKKYPFCHCGAELKNDTMK